MTVDIEGLIAQIKQVGYHRHIKPLLETLGVTAPEALKDLYAYRFPPHVLEAVRSKVKALRKMGKPSIFFYRSECTVGQGSEEVLAAVRGQEVDLGLDRPYKTKYRIVDVERPRSNPNSLILTLSYSGPPVALDPFDDDDTDVDRHELQPQKMLVVRYRIGSQLIEVAGHCDYTMEILTNLAVQWQIIPRVAAGILPDNRWIELAISRLEKLSVRGVSGDTPLRKLKRFKLNADSVESIMETVNGKLKDINLKVEDTSTRGRVDTVSVSFVMNDNLAVTARISSIRPYIFIFQFMDADDLELVIDLFEEVFGLSEAGAHQEAV